MVGLNKSRMASNDHKYILVTGANRYANRANAAAVVLQWESVTDCYFQRLGIGHLHSPG